jgi:hypothetical protein
VWMVDVRSYEDIVPSRVRSTCRQTSRRRARTGGRAQLTLGTMSKVEAARRQASATVHVARAPGNAGWVVRERTRRATSRKCASMPCTWRSGRVVEGSGFENRRTARYQGFESLLLRRETRSRSTRDRDVCRGSGDRADAVLRTPGGGFRLDLKNRSYDVLAVWRGIARTSPTLGNATLHHARSCYG